jgi:hypothetical protein
VGVASRCSYTSAYKKKFDRKDVAVPQRRALAAPPTAMEPVLQDGLWAGVTWKLSNAAFHLENIGQSLGPPENTYMDIVLQSAGAIIDNGAGRAMLIVLLSPILLSLACSLVHDLPQSQRLPAVSATKYLNIRSPRQLVGANRWHRNRSPPASHHRRPMILRRHLLEPVPLQSARYRPTGPVP